MGPDASGLFDLSGRYAFLSGAAGHLGREMALGLARAGAHVYLNGRRHAALEALADEIVAAGGAATVAAFDIQSPGEAEEFLKSIDTLDIVVNNAYSGAPGAFGTHRDEQYRQAYEIAVVAAAKLVDLATPLLAASAVRHGSGAVINVASMYGMVSPDPRIYGTSGSNNPAYYGAAKAALIQYTRYAAVHLAPQSIRVNAISPGPFPPPEIAQTKPEFHAELCRKVPLGRIGHASELAGAVVFLASGASSFVTGINLPVDGGWTAW